MHVQKYLKKIQEDNGPHVSPEEEFSAINEFQDKCLR